MARIKNDVPAFLLEGRRQRLETPSTGLIQPGAGMAPTACLQLLAWTAGLKAVTSRRDESRNSKPPSAWRFSGRNCNSNLLRCAIACPKHCACGDSEGVPGTALPWQCSSKSPWAAQCTSPTQNAKTLRPPKLEASPENGGWDRFGDGLGWVLPKKTQKLKGIPPNEKFGKPSTQKCRMVDLGRGY